MAQEHPTETPDDAPAVRRDVDVAIEPDEVWELLVDDDERAGWFGGPTELEPVPGGGGTFTDPDGTRRRATVEEVEPGRRLAWRWWPEDGDPDEGASRVAVELTPLPGGTRIAVTEVPLAPVARARWSRPAGLPLVELEHRALLVAARVPATA